MSVTENLARVKEEIAETCLRCGRSADEVTLMAVSKFHPIESITEAYNAGQRLFGESHVQETERKFLPTGAAPWRDDHPGALIHMIGPLQRNKTKKTTALFDGIQSVDRLEIIDELTRYAGSRESPLVVLLEWNAGEEQKSGFPDVDSLAAGVERILKTDKSGLVIRGLMTMAPFTDDDKPIHAAFHGLVKARDFLATRFPEVDFSTLSMGMSGDFKIAIEEGSTMVRIGTAIFGERQYATN
jgi:pyridoxal phosphate enzyme (YggS family)